MKPRVEINVLRDLVEIFRAQLVQVGYSANDVYGVVGDDELLTAYYNATRRIVGAGPRTVHRANGFVAPTDPDQARALATIEEKLRRGESVVPYLSRKIRDLSYNDLLFNDWGIHHFHLGTNIEGDGFVNRTCPLLYIVFGDTIDFHGKGNTDAHLLAVMDHNDFATQELVEILHENWPELPQFDMPGVSGDRLSDADIRRLRKLHANYCLRLRDGKSCFAPGGGITSAGTSAIDTTRAMHRIWWAEQQQEMVLSQMPGVIEREMTGSGKGRFREVIDLRLRVSSDASVFWTLVDAHSGYLHPLMHIG